MTHPTHKNQSEMKTNEGFLHFGHTKPFLNLQIKNS